MNRLPWKNIEIYANEATQRFLLNKKNLPLKFLSANFAASGEDLYFMYFEDTKITGWNSQKTSTLGYFRVTLNPDFLDGQTQSIDMAAKIPSNFNGSNRVVLRIAYTILCLWQRCVIEAYKTVATDKYSVTLANAMKWYDELK